MSRQQRGEHRARQPRAGQQPHPAKFARGEKRRHRQQPQIPDAVDERARGNQARERDKVFEVRLRLARHQQDDHQTRDGHVERPAEHKPLRQIRDDHCREQRHQPRLRPFQPRQRCGVHQEEQRHDGKNDEPFRIPAGRAMHRPEQPVPADALVNLERRADHQDVRPRLAADGLGAMPQRVVAGQVAVFDDLQRNQENDQGDQSPDGERNVAAKSLGQF